MASIVIDGNQINRVFEAPIDLVADRLEERLRTEGFVLLADIPLQEVLETHLNQEIPPLRVLSVVHPRLANEALCENPSVGGMFPHQFTLQSNQAGRTEVSLVNPSACLLHTAREPLGQIAERLRLLLVKAMQQTSV